MRPILTDGTLALDFLAVSALTGLSRGCVKKSMNPLLNLFVDARHVQEEHEVSCESVGA